jgi:hypothetical protein
LKRSLTVSGFINLIAFLTQDFGNTLSRKHFIIGYEDSPQRCHKNVFSLGSGLFLFLLIGKRSKQCPERKKNSDSTSGAEKKLAKKEIMETKASHLSEN